MSSGRGRGQGPSKAGKPGHPKGRDLDRELNMLRRKRELLQREQEILSMERDLERKRQYEQTNCNMLNMYGDVWEPPLPKRANVPQQMQPQRDASQNASTSRMPQPMPSNYIPSLMEIKVPMPHQPTDSKQQTMTQEIMKREVHEMLDPRLRNNTEEKKMQHFNVDNEEDSDQDSNDYSIFGDDADVEPSADIEEQNVFDRPQVRFLLQNISRSARKRFRIMISDKVPWEQAMVMCQKRWNELTNYTRPRKRKFLQKLNYMLVNEAPPVETDYFSKTDRCAEVHIQNVQRMTAEQAEMVRHCIIDRILKLPKGEGPRFEDYGFRVGVLSVNCRDKQSQVWLVTNVPQLEPWPGARLAATIAQVIRKRYVLKVLVPLSETTDVARALSMFKAQNRGLNTEEWKLEAAQPVEEGTFIAVSVDERSMNVLKESQYRACLGLKTVYFAMVQRKLPNPMKPMNPNKPKKPKKPAPPKYYNKKKKKRCY